MSVSDDEALDLAAFLVNLPSDILKNVKNKYIFANEKKSEYVHSISKWLAK